MPDSQVSSRNVEFIHPDVLAAMNRGPANITEIGEALKRSSEALSALSWSGKPASEVRKRTASVALTDASPAVAARKDKEALDANP